MFDVYSWAFVVVFSVAFLISAAYSLRKIYIRRKFFTRECLLEYEQELKPYCFSIDDSTEDLAKKLNKRIVYKKTNKEAFVDKRKPDIINVNKSLSPEKRTFAIVHEFGHILRGYDAVAARDIFRFFSALSAEEQICDYYSAAILFPKDDMVRRLADEKFDEIGEEKRIEFIRKLAKEKKVMDDVVCRRISEIKLIMSAD